MKLRNRLANSNPPHGLAPAERDELRRESEQRIGEAARQLKADDRDSAARNLEWSRQAQLILDATQPPQSKIKTAALVSLFCLLLAGLALWLRTDDIPVVLEAELDDVTLQLVEGRPWDAGSLDIQALRLQLNNLQDLNAPGLGLSGPLSSLMLQTGESGKGLRLQGLSASAGSRLLLYVTDFPRLDVKAGVLKGRIQARNIHLHLPGAGGSRAQEIGRVLPETLHFTTRQSGVDPAQLTLESRQPWRIDGLRVGELVLEREQPPGSNQWESSLLKGKMRLLETEEEITLHEGDRLRLGRVEGHRLAIEFDPKQADRFKLMFQGTVEKVETGPSGFIRNRAPTWLAYLYHQQTLALFWSTVVFLWGMFWSLRRLL